MLNLFHVAEEAEHVEEVDPGELEAVRRRAGWLWLDAVGASEAEIERVCGVFGFDALSVDDVLSPSEYPKVDAYTDYTFVVLHGLSDDETRLRTVEVDLFLGSGYLVTFHGEDVPGFAWVRDEVVRRGSVGGLGPDRLFALLAEAGAARFNSLADVLEDEIEEMEERAVAGDPGVIGKVHAYRRDAVRLRRVLSPQRDAIARIRFDELPGIGDQARLRLGNAKDRYDRSGESLEASRTLLSAVLDTYRAAVAERANEVMKVLTVFAAILLPLSLIAGVYGMNFAHMPELAWRWAYPLVLGAMLAVAVGLWTYFARRGFVGGPRLRRIPGAVGSGLAGLLRLTAKPVDLVGRMITGGRHPSD